MHDLPTDWSALCALVFLLGMRHGFDADHLAAIDGLTRLSSRHARRFARYCGALFSLGHRWAAPAWLDALGAWISIAFLLLVGVTNLRAALEAEKGSVVALVGVKGRFLGRLMQARSPLGVAGVGFLFALSFDTVSQSALFAVTALQFSGVTSAVMLGLLFVLGMFAADGLNGWWIARLISRADRTAAIASRIMSVAVSGVSLLVAALGIGKMLSPAINGWSDGKELGFGLAVVLVIASSYLAARWFARVSPQRAVRVTTN